VIDLVKNGETGTKKEAILVAPSATLVSHSRTNRTKPEQKVSEVYKGIIAGAVARAYERGVNLTVLSPEEYHDPDEHLGLLEKANEINADYIITPFTLVESPREKKFLDILSSSDSRKIAVNVPANQRAIQRLGNKYIGYTGMEETYAGTMIAEQLLLSTGMTPGRIIVLEHERKEEHYALALRFEGIKRIAERYGCSVESLYVGTEKQQVMLPTDEKYYVVYLGIRGYEAALSINPDQILGLAGVDLNSQMANDILNLKVNCTVVQSPFYQGRFAIDMMFEPPQENPLFWGCGPRLVNFCNVRVENQGDSK